jgi:hypothetical protein
LSYAKDALAPGEIEAATIGPAGSTTVASTIRASNTQLGFGTPYHRPTFSPNLRRESWLIEGVAVAARVANRRFSF